MTKAIDCLLIGHNEIPSEYYEKEIRRMGVSCGAYRDLNLNLIWYNDKPYSAAEIFTLFHRPENGSLSPSESNKYSSSGVTFSAAIAYLGTYLNRRGISFDYVNSFRDEKDELAQKLARENITAIAVTTTLYVTALPILEILEFIRKYNRTAKIIIGGPFALTHSRTLEPAVLEYLFSITIGADIYVISSQGEAALVEIIHALKNNTSMDQIPNIYYKTAEGYKSTPMVEENNKLSDNMVNWSLFANKMNPLVSVRTSISCPFSCAFCGFPERAGNYQTAEVEKIEEELNELNKIEATKIVKFIDDTFNVPTERFKKILKMMIKNRYKFKWFSNFRCQFADRETLELMKESGCEGVFLGIESGNNNVLKNMNKNASVEKYLVGIELLREFQVLTMGSFIIGFPGETNETARDTMNFIKESKIDLYQAQTWYCTPITPVYREKEKYNLSGKSFEWRHNTMNSAEAADWVEKIFLTTENPIWIPQYNFSFDNFWDMQLRGMDLDRVKDFLRGFSNGIKEKLTDPLREEISFHVLLQLKNNCAIGDNNGDWENKKSSAINKESVRFNF